MKLILIYYAIKALIGLFGIAVVIIATHKILAQNPRTIDAEFIISDTEELPKPEQNIQKRKP